MLKALLGAVAISGVLVAGAPGAEMQDVLFLRTPEGVTLVRTDPHGAIFRIPGAVPSTDWSAVVSADTRGTETHIVAQDSITGTQLWSRDVGGKLEVRVASPGARFVALGTPRDDGGYPDGRSTTQLVIVGADTEPRPIELEGNYEPEAFSTDGESLFVVEYLPARNPTRYRVRRLDLRAEEVVGVYTVDGHLQEAMQGTARVQAASADGRRLYTLYTLQGPDGVRRAFVHVLSLDELWAHCVDLPSSFGEAREHAIGIAVAPDGERVYAADASTGTIAEIDTQALTVARTAGAPLSVRGGVAHAAVGTGGNLYVGRDTDLIALDPSTLVTMRSWEMDSRISGLQPGHDGSRLYVGLKDEIVVLDTATGRRVGVLDPENGEPIDQLGEATRPLDIARKVIECAC